MTFPLTGRKAEVITLSEESERETSITSGEI